MKFLEIGKGIPKGKGRKTHHIIVKKYIREPLLGGSLTIGHRTRQGRIKRGLTQNYRKKNQKNHKNYCYQTSQKQKSLKKSKKNTQSKRNS